jgi:hypothetical protein
MIEKITNARSGVIKSSGVIKIKKNDRKMP